MRFPINIRPKFLFALLLAFASILLTSCSQRYINAHTVFLNRSQLASYHVETPDPNLNHPLMGQRLLVNWNVPLWLIQSYPDLHLEITIRFGDRTEIVKKVRVSRTSGYYLYEILDENYFDKEGILTYKIDLISNGEIIEKWRHQLWAEIITVGENNSEQDECEESEK